MVTLTQLLRSRQLENFTPPLIYAELCNYVTGIVLTDDIYLRINSHVLFALPKI